MGSLPAASRQCIVKPFGGGASGPGSYIGGGNQTIGTICQIPAGAVWLRLRFACWSAADVPIANAAYAPTSQLGDGYNAYDAAGQISATGWRAVTFGSQTKQSCVDQINAGAAEAVAAACMPGIRGERPAWFEPRTVCSDWLPFDALSRVDGGAEALINLRLYVRQGEPPFRLGHAAAPAAAVDFTVAGTYASGNHAIPPFGGFGHEFAVSAVHCIDVIGTRPTRTLIVVGDSIGSGDYTTGSGTSYGLAAARMLTRRDLATSAAILANPLQTTLCFIANASRFIADELAALHGSIMVLQCWSSNDPPTLEAAQASFRAAVALAAFCLASGVTVILATAAPVFSGAPEREATRRHANELARRAGLPCLDIDQIVGNGATPNAYEPGLAAWDNVHLNDAGQLAVAEQLVSMILALIGA